jgi:hypothetical protein
VAVLLTMWMRLSPSSRLWRRNWSIGKVKRSMGSMSVQRTGSDKPKCASWVISQPPSGVGRANQSVRD